MHELEEKIRVLEEKFEYQDHTVETLNQVIIQQQAQLDQVQTELTKLREFIIATTVESEDVNDPPPHY